MNNSFRFQAVATALLASVFLLPPAVADPNTKTPPTYSAEVFYETTDFLISGTGYAFSPNKEHLLITSDESGVYNVYALNLKTNQRTALTNSTTNAVYAINYFPDGERYLYTSDNGGDELNHVYVAGAKTGARDLTPGEKLKAAFVAWVDDGTAFILQTNERDSRFFDLYRYDASNFERTLIFENDLGLGSFVISRDGTKAAGIKSRTSADNNIYLIAFGSDAAPQNITKHEGNISYSVYGFTPENDKLVYGTNQYGEFRQAWSYDLVSNEKAKLVEDDWDISYLFYSPSGRYRVHGANVDASTEVTIIDRISGEQVTLPTTLPQGNLRSVRFTRDETYIAFLINAPTSPSNVFTVNLQNQSFAQHTKALNPEINAAHLVNSKVVRYKSFDGLEIPSILYKPLGASKDNPVPALVWVHGGPGGQTRTGYSAAIQHLANNGYAILGANNRGSSGYGKTFFHMDDKKHGDVDLQDIVYGRKYLESLDWVDHERIGIIGGSYGGFMVMAALAFEPEVFDVGINIFGVTNWERTLTSIPPWWESFKESLYSEMGDPETDGERHRQISPLFHAKNVTKPVLIVQGANDPRVLQVESDEMVAALRENNVPVEYVLFPDEGHGFRSRANRITASDAYVQFLDTYLKEASKQDASE
ncbi:MAG: S9 family peptidase [Robiginitomaculum sp.]|nr:S9 family peptidase [Robiginitomaculum sp.]